MKLTSAQKTQITEMLQDLTNDPFNDILAKQLFEMLVEERFARSDLFTYLASEINRLKSNFLHWLVRWDETQLVKQLIKAGVYIDIPDNMGNHPLHVAAEYAKSSMVKMLLEIDKTYIDRHLLPETRIKNKSGHTPIKVCTLHNIKRLLEQHDRDFDKSHLETPIADTNQTSFSWEDKDAACFNVPKKLIAPVGQIQWKDLSKFDLEENVSQERWGSGFLIGPNTFLTAGHCFDPLPLKYNKHGQWHCVDSITGKPISSYQLPQLMTVNFNYQRAHCGSETDNPADYEVQFEIVSLEEHRKGDGDGLDYAIVKLKPKPSYVGPKAKMVNLSDFGTLNLASVTPNVGAQLIIPQHPQGKPKKLEAGTLKKVDENGTKIFYKVSTEGGSSGSPVLDAKSQAVVAIHTTGFGEQKDLPLNSGVTIAAVRKVSPIIRGMFFSQKSEAKVAAKTPARALTNQNLAFQSVMETSMSAEIETPIRRTTKQPPAEPKHLVLYEKAFQYYQQGQIEIALESFRELYNNYRDLLTKTEKADVLFCFGSCQLQLANYTKAREAFALSNEFEPDETCVRNYDLANQKLQAQLQAQQQQRESCTIM